MLLRELVKKVQRALNAAGEHPPFDETGEFGPRTTAALENYDVEIVLKKKEVVPMPTPKTPAPWLDEAKKSEGKKESDSKFGAWLAGFWKYVGLPQFTSIVGSARAWCGLFVATALISVGVHYQKDGAGAKNWDKFGVAIDWKKDGIPRGAIVRINHGANCSSGSGNHVAFSDGDCAPADLKSGSIRLFGGNQSDQANVTAFPVAHICSVRWPQAPAPEPITKSFGCKAAGSGGSKTTSHDYKGPLKRAG